MTPASTQWHLDFNAALCDGQEVDAENVCHIPIEDLSGIPVGRQIEELTRHRWNEEFEAWPAQSCRDWQQRSGKVEAPPFAHKRLGPSLPVSESSNTNINSMYLQPGSGITEQMMVNLRRRIVNLMNHNGAEDMQMDLLESKPRLVLMASKINSNILMKLNKEQHGLALAGEDRLLQAKGFGVVKPEHPTLATEHDPNFEGDCDGEKLKGEEGGVRACSESGELRRSESESVGNDEFDEVDSKSDEWVECGSDEDDEGDEEDDPKQGLMKSDLTEAIAYFSASKGSKKEASPSGGSAVGSSTS